MPDTMPVDMWAERKDNRIRIMISVNSGAAFEFMSYPDTAVIENGRLVFPIFTTVNDA